MNLMSNFSIGFVSFNSIKVINKLRCKIKKKKKKKKKKKLKLLIERIVNNKQ